LVVDRGMISSGKYSRFRSSVETSASPSGLPEEAGIIGDPAS
jgi:hypothetical protein